MTSYRILPVDAKTAFGLELRIFELQLGKVKENTPAAQNSYSKIQERFLNLKFNIDIT